jgi:hypothetical protein
MRLRLGLLGLCLVLFGSPALAAPATPCARVQAQPDAWVTAQVDALVLAARAAYEREEEQAAYQRVIGHIAATIKQCRLAQDESFIGRYREFIEYVKAADIARLPDHELGFVVPDGQYFAETRPLVQIPEFLLTPDFLRAVSRSETLARAKTLLQQLNASRAADDQLIYFSYTSRHLGTPDNNDSYRRLLIVVPGHAERGEPEKWVQFGVTDPGARVRVRNVSVVSTVPASDGTANVYFKDFYRTYRRDGSITINGRWELGEGDDNCVLCHKSGILPIFPAAGSVSAAEQSNVAAVNQRFRAYGTPRFDKYLDTRVFGPGLGTADATDRIGRFGANFTSTTVARAMTCAACHQIERLGALNWPMDRTIISSYIKGGQMPYGYTLQAVERNALYDRLIQEYFATDPTHPGILKSWLLGRTH